jgi:hypothetical protein
MKLRLWDALADVALKQHDKESAALTMEVAVSFDRDNFARQERLAKMYFSMGPSAADKAIAQHQYLLSKKPDRIDSYKALAALFFQAGAHDKMWCVAGALTCLGKADPPLRALYENFRPTQVPSTPGKLNEELWRKILHPTENNYLGALFALLSPAIAMTTAQPHKVIGLDRHARMDMAGNNWSYAAALRYVANTIEAALPDVFIKKDRSRHRQSGQPEGKEHADAGPGDRQWFRSIHLAKSGHFRPGQTHGAVAPRALSTLCPWHHVRSGNLGARWPAAGRLAHRPGGHKDEVDKMAKQLEGLLAAPLRTELKSALPNATSMPAATSWTSRAGSALRISRLRARPWFFAVTSSLLQVIAMEPRRKVP